MPLDAALRLGLLVAVFFVLFLLLPLGVTLLLFSVSVAYRGSSSVEIWIFQRARGGEGSARKALYASLGGAPGAATAGQGVAPHPPKPAPCAVWPKGAKCLERHTVSPGNNRLASSALVIVPRRILQAL